MENAASPVPAVPTPPKWPGGFGAYKPSRDAVRLNLSPLVLLVLLAFGGSFVISLIQSGFSPAHDTTITVRGFTVAIVFNVLSSIFGAFVNGAQVRTYLAGVRGQRVEFSEAARTGWEYIWKLFLLSLLIGASVFGGLLLLIVPGLIILPRLLLAPYFLIDQNLSVLGAYKASWHATKGHSWKVWGIIGVSSLMVLPVITIIGILATIYLEFMYAAAFAFLYVFIAHKSTAPAASNPAS